MAGLSWVVPVTLLLLAYSMGATSTLLTLTYYILLSSIISLTLLLVLLTALFLHDLLTYKPFTPAAKRSRLTGNRRYQSYQQLQKVLSSYAGENSSGEVVIDAVIIGSGQGGLSCGSILAQLGERVVVFEQHEVTGGGAHTFAVDGKAKWRFGAGFHITIPPHEQVLQLACGADNAPVTFNALHDETGVSDYIALGEPPQGESPVAVKAGPLKGQLDLEIQLAKRFPAHTENLRRYFDLSERIQTRFGLLVASAILPDWMRVLFMRSPFMSVWRKWAAKTTAQGLIECFPGDDEDTRKLRSYLIGLWLNTGAPPNRCTFFMQTSVMGGWQKLGEAYPQGGTQNTALAMVEAIEARGGAVFIRSPVARILRDAGTGQACGVVLWNGDVVRARRVISAINYRLTEAMLCAPPISSEDEDENVPPPQGWRDDLFRLAASPNMGQEGEKHPLYQPPAKPLETGQAMGFIMANIGLQGKTEDFDATPSTLWLQPGDSTNGYDALRGCEAFYEDPIGVPVEQIPLCITFGTAKGEEGAMVCQILVAGEWEWFQEHLQLEKESSDEGSRHAPPHVKRVNQDAYNAIKEKWTERLLEVLYRHFPKTRGHIEFCDISTPLTDENYLWSLQGSAFGLDSSPSRFVSESHLMELGAKHPRVSGLWRCGQDYLLCGQVLAAASGVMTALRMRGPIDIARFLVRAARLLLLPNNVKKKML